MCIAPFNLSALLSAGVLLSLCPENRQNLFRDLAGRRARDRKEEQLPDQSTHDVPCRMLLSKSNLNLYAVNYVADIFQLQLSYGYFRTVRINGGSMRGNVSICGSGLSWIHVGFEISIGKFGS